MCGCVCKDTSWKGVIKSAWAAGVELGRLKQSSDGAGENTPRTAALPAAQPPLALVSGTNSERSHLTSGGFTGRGRSWRRMEAPTRNDLGQQEAQADLERWLRTLVISQALQRPANKVGSGCAQLGAPHSRGIYSQWLLPALLGLFATQPRVCIPPRTQQRCGGRHQRRRRTANPHRSLPCAAAARAAAARLAGRGALRRAPRHGRRRAGELSGAAACAV